GAHRLEPVLATVGIHVPRLDALRCEPVRTFPAELGSEAGALALEPLIERRQPQRPAALVFLMRPGHRIVLAVGLDGARQHPAAIAVQRAEAADIDRPEVHGRLAARDPFGERAAGPPGASNAEGIEAGADIEVPDLRRLAEDEVAVGRKRLRP